MIILLKQFMGKKKFLPLLQSMKYYKAKTEQDFKFIASLFNPKNNKYLIKKRVNIKQLQEWDNSSKKNDYILTDNKKIGWFSIVQLDNSKEGKFGMIIDKSYQNKGYGQQAMKLIEKEGKKLGIKKFKIQVFENNKAAIKIYKKFGYKEKYSLLAMEKKL